MKNANIQYRHTRENSGLRLDWQLRFWHDGELVEHPRVARAFLTGMQRLEDGRYRTVVGNDWAMVEVEDAAFEVESIEVEEAAVKLSLSNGMTEVLDPMTLRVDPDGVMSVGVQDGKARARMSRNAQYALGARLVAEEALILLSCGAITRPTSLGTTQVIPLGQS